MKPSEERLTEFNGRMNTWISKQGLIFQLTHGGTGLGGHPPIIGSLIRAFVSLCLIALLAGLGYLGFLTWKASGDELPAELALGIASALNVDKVEARGFSRTSSSAKFSDIFAVGDEDSFFNALRGRQVQFSMGLTDGLFGKEWTSQKLALSSFTCDVKGGALDDELASKMWTSLFEERPGFKFSSLEIRQTNLSWGYESAPTWGQVKDARLTGTRTEAGWNLVLSEGYFSQGYFRDFEIQEMKLSLNQTEGLQITAAKLLCDGGSFQFSAETIQGGASPVIRCQGELTNVPLAIFLPRGVLSLVNGRVSGTMTGEGSPNDTNGISFQLDLQTSEEEPLYLTSNIPLLRILSQLDPKHSYRKLPFNAGSFHLESKGEDITFSEIDLRSLRSESEDTTIFAQITGSLTGRPSTPADLADQSLILKDLVEEAPTATIGAAPEITPSFAEEVLRQFQNFQFSNPQSQFSLVTKDSKGEELKRYRIDEVLRRPFRSPFVLEGELQLSVPSAAFIERAALPNTTLPEDSSSDLLTVTIPVRDFMRGITRNLSAQWEEALSNSE